MDNSKNLVLAVVLSMLVLTGWHFFYDLPKQREAQKIALEKKEAEKIAHPQSAAQSDNNGAAPKIANEIVAKDRGEAIKESPRLIIKSEQVDGSISLKGARFDDLNLVHYRQTIDSRSPEVTLLSPSSTNDVYFGEFGWVSPDASIKVPDSSTIWKTDSKELTPEHPVTLTWQNDQGITFKQTIKLDKDYLFTVTQSVENNSGKAAQLMPYGLINRSHHKAETFFILHEGPLGVFNNTLEEITYSDITDEKKMEFKSSPNGWVGFTDKYWLTALIPDKNSSFSSRLNYINDKGIDKYQVDFLGDKITINPGDRKESSSHFFAGAKEVKLLDSYSQNLNIPLFDRAIDFGWFYFLTKRLFYALNYLYLAVGNFGIAIILLTICVKLLMFPLANKSYKSMSQMKALQPEITRIREQNKDDKMALNQEIMKLYKKDGVNPLSGCLPLIIQIPVFFSLYKVLFVTIEMRHAPFYGWLRDLSAPDPTSIFNLFGLIPWDPPLFLMIGVLPLLMGLTMFIQQQLNPAPSDPIQAQMMKFLPLLFIFLFASFPAGLVLYWVCSNIISIIQQLIISKTIKPRSKKLKNA